MKFLLTTISFLLCFAFVQAQEVKPLSKSQKLEDFNYLYFTLKNAYPYFGINKRQNKIDWLGNYKTYKRLVKKAKTDQVFADVMKKIVYDLNNGHTDFMPTEYYSYFYDGYKAHQEAVPRLKAYVQELEKYNAKDKAPYWTKLLADAPKEKESEAGEKEEESLPNLECHFDKDKNITVLKIRSFSYEFIEADKDTLKQLIDKIQSYKNLVIDIQGNGGGDMDYWLEHIVPYLIKKPLVYPIVYTYLNGDSVKHFRSDIQHVYTVKDFDYPNMPPELQSGKYLFRKVLDTVPPAIDRVKFNGNIYLLVDKGVYSSSETLAYFSKVTGFAKVVGQQTGGDGIGVDPFLLTLPNSGIVIRYPGDMGLNADGSANDEYKTVPDIKLDGKDEKERTEELLKMIRDGK